MTVLPLQGQGLLGPADISSWSPEDMLEMANWAMAVFMMDGKHTPQLTPIGQRYGTPKGQWIDPTTVEYCEGVDARTKVVEVLNLQVGTDSECYRMLLATSRSQFIVEEAGPFGRSYPVLTDGVRHWRRNAEVCRLRSGQDFLISEISGDPELLGRIVKRFITLIGEQAAALADRHRSALGRLESLREVKSRLIGY